MFRLLLLAMVLAVPASEALQCYQCSDMVAAIAEGLGGLGASGAAAVGKAGQSCAGFDPADPKFADDCPRGQTAACMKMVNDGQTTRTCSGTALDACDERGGVTACFCTGELCNSAGLASPALLLLTASLLAALLKA